MTTWTVQSPRDLQGPGQMILQLHTQRCWRWSPADHQGEAARFSYCTNIRTYLIRNIKVFKYLALFHRQSRTQRDPASRDTTQNVCLSGGVSEKMLQHLRYKTNVKNSFRISVKNGTRFSPESSSLPSRCWSHLGVLMNGLLGEVSAAPFPPSSARTSMSSSLRTETRSQC